MTIINNISNMFIMIIILIILLMMLFITGGNQLLLIPPDPDEFRDIHQLIRSRGYHLHEYNVLTEDQYILTIHRVVPKISLSGSRIFYDDPISSYNKQRKPVVIFHGVLTDTAVWYFNSPPLSKQSSIPPTSAYYHSLLNDTQHCEDNFGFCMLKTGRYDLWVANARGNRYSRKHIRYSPEKDREFWRYSLDQIALYDIPAIVDLIRTITGHRTLGWIGYSQGAGSMFALLSIRPEFGQIIRPFICWAPGIYFNNAKTLVGPLLVASIPYLVSNPGEYRLSSSPVNVFLQYPACHHRPGNLICSIIYQAIFGPTNHLNITRIPTYFHYIPSSISNWQVAHFTQIAISGRFRRFDYLNVHQNIAAYGQSEPPDYPLYRIPKHIPIVIMYGATDWFIDPEDIHLLIYTLRNYGLRNVISYPIQSEYWNHVDYITGQGAGQLVYDPTVKYLDLYAW